MIRIAFVIDAIGTPIGGTEQQLLLLLRELDRERFEPHLILLTPRSDDLTTPANLSVHSFPAMSFATPGTYGNLLRLVTLLRREKFDIVQTHFRQGNIAGILCALLARVPCIVSTRRGMRYWQTPFQLRSLRMLNRHVTHFLANSHGLAEALKRYELVEPDRITVIHNGCEEVQNPELPVLEEQRLRAELGLGSSYPIVITIANLRPVKRIDVLIDACALVCHQHATARFLVLGTGQLAGQLREKASELGVSERILFAGHRRDSRNLLGVADIGVLCSDSEGLSNAVLEYMAAGLPVICTDVGGNRELVDDDVNGFLTPRGQPQPIAVAILRLLNKPELRERMGRASKHRVSERFSVESMVTRTQDFYQRLVSGGTHS